ncbi:hypothetical protein Tco_1027051 [Tanacetum coccineum]
MELSSSLNCDGLIGKASYILQNEVPFSNFLSLNIAVMLVPSCFAIFDLEPLTLSLDFVLMYEIFKSLSFRLDRLFRLAILYLDQHAYTLHHLESLLTISFDRLDILKEDLFEHKHVVVNSTLAGMRHHHLHLYMNTKIKQLAIKRVDEYGFVIRLDLVRLMSGSVGPFYSINTVPVIR